MTDRIPYEWMDTLKEPCNFGISSPAIHPMTPEQERRLEQELNEMLKAAEKEEKERQQHEHKYFIW